MRHTGRRGREGRPWRVEEHSVGSRDIADHFHPEVIGSPLCRGESRRPESALGALGRRPVDVRAIIGGTVGLPEHHFTTLAALELAGSVGILLGRWREPLGIAAAIGLTLYFTGALIAHLRVGDTKHLTMPAPTTRSRHYVLVLRVMTL